MSGWDLIAGHGRAVDALRRASQAERPHHGYLLMGREGLGKATVAAILARALLCEAAPEQRPCDACVSCRKVASGSHPDCWTELPGGKSNIISVEQVAEVQRRVAFRRAEGRFRVVVFDGGGTMNVQAQNKLLKTLEEPPTQTVLVLCALHPGQLLPTIRSRCQKLSFGPVPDGEIQRWLVERHGADPEAAAGAVAASRGIPARALGFLDAETQQTRATQLADVLRALSGEPGAAGALAQSVDRDREGCGELLGLVQELLRDAMSASAGSALPPLVADLPADAPALPQLSPRFLARGVERVEAARARLHRNVHPGGVLEDLLLQIGSTAP
jgi:DNA polymerase-3 subunit delta'